MTVAVDSELASLRFAKAELERQLDERTAERDKAEARQIATSAILHVISQSPTDMQPVFDAIVLAAVRLLRCDGAFVIRCDSANFWPVASAGPGGLFPNVKSTGGPIDPDANFPSRAIVGKQTLHLPDWTRIDLPEHERHVRDTHGINSALFVPLLRKSECIGLLAMTGKRAGIFGESEIALAESFRDQAVIAIENVSLFEQLAASEARFRELNETLRQRVEEQARERDRIWNVSQDLLAVADVDGKFLSVNPAWTETLGWSEGELIGKTFEWLIHADDRAKTHAELARLAGGHKTLHFENRFRHKRGSYCWLSWRAVTDKGRVYAVARDVTDLKNAEEQLRASHRELAQASHRSTMGAMTASIAHEVNQPLSAIVTNATAGLRWLARAEPDLDEARAHFKRIIDDGHRASEVIAGIRSMFGKDRHQSSPASVNDLVGEVLAVVRGELEGHQISLQFSMPDGLPQVMAERVQLQQVLLNLITNAIDAMSSVTDRERVLTLKLEVCESDHVLITLEDTGTGIDPSEMDHIFDAFFTTKADGMGMGLSICRSIIESHNGLLWASARRPHGSIFYIKLAALNPDAQETR